MSQQVPHPDCEVCTGEAPVASPEGFPEKSSVDAGSRADGVITTPSAFSERIPAEVFSPWDTVREEIGERGWSLAEFAGHLGRPVAEVEDMMDRGWPVTPAIAKELSAVLGITSGTFLNLDFSFRRHGMFTESNVAEPTPNSETGGVLLKALERIAEEAGRMTHPKFRSLGDIARTALAVVAPKGETE